MNSSISHDCRYGEKIGAGALTSVISCLRERPSVALHLKKDRRDLPMVVPGKREVCLSLLTLGRSGLLASDDFKADILVCDDLGNELADFIALQPFEARRRGFARTKSASAFHDICSQAMKNLGPITPHGIGTPFHQILFEYWLDFDHPAGAGLSSTGGNDNFLIPDINPIELLYFRPTHTRVGGDRVKMAGFLASAFE
jgi:hypothetical protein